MIDDLITRDLKNIWHPCSQMKDYETFPPLKIKKARGSYLYLEDGKKIIDAISSWWCKSLGHGHPRLKEALLKQINYFEHVIFANTTNETIVALSEKLTTLTKNLTKVFYASEGSSAVEIALKMSLHSRKITGQTKRKKFMALANSYHGETCLALSVSDLGLYREAYEELLTPVFLLHDLPYVSGKQDPLWDDCSEYWPHIEAQLQPHAENLTAIIIEPIVQGSGGMQVYSKDFLRRLRQWTAAHDIHLIADEIMTGIGRTGLPLACQHAEIEPDILCLGKGLTSGWLPFSAVVTAEKIYECFYDDYHAGKNFLHSHTYSGNALAASVALATLNVMTEENIYLQVQQQEKYLQALFYEIARETGCLHNVRGIGAIVAGDLVGVKPGERKGFKIFQKAVELGAFLRPLGDTIYWLPPLNVDFKTLDRLAEITKIAIKAADSKF